jgi:TPR repeat protein
MDRFSNAMKRTIASFFLCLLLATPAWAGFDEGVAAYHRGDYATALREWRPLAEQGIGAAQGSLGSMYFMGHGVPQDYVKGAKWVRKAAERGNAFGQTELGTMYSLGRGVLQDFTEAVRWFRKAAEQGNAKGHAKLGVMYFLGTGVPQDYVQAHKWLNLAVSQGDKNAATVRDQVAKKMTPAQIAEAQRMARDWVSAFNKRKGK